MTSKEHQERAARQAPTVRAENVLRVLTGAFEPLTVATIAKRVGEKPRDVYSLLGDMVKEGWVTFGSSDYPWMSRPVTVTQKGLAAYMACSKLVGGAS